MKTIYSITNKVNGKRYIGMSSQVSRRWINHKYHLKVGDHRNNLLQDEWNLFGSNSFLFEILEQCDCSIRDLETKEQEYIKLFDSYNNGYNKTLGGRGAFGYVMSEELRLKQHYSMLGNTYSLGKIKSKVTRLRMSESGKRRKDIDDLRIKSRLKMKRLWSYDWFRCKMKKLNSGNKYNLGKHLSDNTKKLLSEMRTGTNNPFYGRTHTQETRDIISASSKSKWQDEKYRKSQLEIKKVIMNSDEYKETMSLAVRGENNGNASLSTIDALHIRLRYLNGDKPRFILKDYPFMSNSGLKKVCHNDSWKHLPNTISELESMIINYQ